MLKIIASLYTNDQRTESKVLEIWKKVNKVEVEFLSLVMMN